MRSLTPRLSLPICRYPNLLTFTSSKLLLIDYLHHYPPLLFPSTSSCLYFSLLTCNIPIFLFPLSFTSELLFSSLQSLLFFYPASTPFFLFFFFTTILSFTYSILFWSLFYHLSLLSRLSSLSVLYLYPITTEPSLSTIKFLITIIFPFFKLQQLSASHFFKIDCLNTTLLN